MSAEVTKSHLKTGEVNDSLSLGSANISDAEVKLAIDALIKKMAPVYFELISKNSNVNSSREKTTDLGKIKVYPGDITTNKDQKLENEIYLIQFYVMVKYLQDSDALGRLLIKLKNRITELVSEPSSVATFYIALEKGILETDHSNATNFWHRDKARTSITTCFSNIEKWSTQIVDENKIPDEKKEGINSYWRRVEKKEYCTLASEEVFRSTLEPIRMPAKQGNLYDAKKLFHRAPISSDVKVGPNDIRLFIRFEEY